jgi:acetyl-CoA carboxylase biotin carboxyl carrier protein
MVPVAEHHARVTELAELMKEFRLSDAQLTVDGLTIGFRKRQKPTAPLMAGVPAPANEAAPEDWEPEELEIDDAPEAIQGIPVTSPMTGIFYSSPSPGSPPFVKEGDTVTTGQPVGLIEAMKVFNEIPCPVSGTVVKINANDGKLVQPGDVLFVVS